MHINNFPSVLNEGKIYCDRIMQSKNLKSFSIGLSDIKKRRLNKLKLSSYPALFVGDFVPFYFCPRSIMLYLIYKKNPNLKYKGGQSDIIHLEADLFEVIKWATINNIKWAFTFSNAGAYYFKDSNLTKDLEFLNWDAIESDNWAENTIKEAKQSEFLLENSFDISLVRKIGVQNYNMFNNVNQILKNYKMDLKVEIKKNWYY